MENSLQSTESDESSLKVFNAALQESLKKEEDIILFVESLDPLFSVSWKVKELSVNVTRLSILDLLEVLKINNIDEKVRDLKRESFNIILLRKPTPH